MEPTPPAFPESAAPAPAPAARLPDLGELMTAGTNVVINSPGIFLGIWAASGLPSFVLSTVAFSHLGLADNAAIKAAVEQRRFDQLAALGAVGVVSWLFTQFQSTAVIVACAEGVAGRDPNLGDALKRALVRLPAVIWTQLVVVARVVVLPLVCLLGFAFALRGQLSSWVIIGALVVLWMIAVGVMVVLLIRYGFAQFVAALEGESGSDAVRRSRDLIVPHMAKVVGNVLVFLLVVVFVAFALGLAGAIAQLIANRVAGSVAGYAVQAAVRGVITLASAWMLAGFVTLYAALSAGTPRST